MKKVLLSVAFAVSCVPSEIHGMKRCPKINLDVAILLDGQRRSSSLPTRRIPSPQELLPLPIKTKKKHSRTKSKMARENRFLRNLEYEIRMFYARCNGERKRNKSC